ncbi:MAG: DUF3048 domain-containing protein [Eubacterium sp.]|nr:DUF3048 domain-containing protein [Eubacterium sp.]
MSEKEIDQILKELKQHSEAESAPAPKIQQASQEEPQPAKEEIKAEANPEPEQAPEPVAKEEPQEEKTPVVDEEPQSSAQPEEDNESNAKEQPSKDDEDVDLFTLSGDGEQEVSAEVTEPSEIKEEPYEAYYENEPAAPKRNKALVIILSILLLVGIIACAYLGIMAFKGGTEFEKGEQEVTVAETTVNPLTGIKDLSGYAAGKRPVAVVAENEYGIDAVRPQWGINNADIVFEGETEYSTRLLLFFADHTKIPAQVGPARSARPPFIRFSELFNSIFIHAGLSHSKGDYVGADTVFKNDKVDHVNILDFDPDGKYMGRDPSRTKIVEHTCYFNGKNIEALLKERKINDKIDESKFTKLQFNENPQPLSEKSGKTVKFRWSSENCKETVTFTYDAQAGNYTTKDYDSRFGEANVQFQNVILLLDKTEYIEKKDYQGSGNSETYCNYALAGGKGKILSQGTVIDITWGVENGKLVFKNSKGEQVKLNPGKSYIGYGSSNNGGKITVK